MAWGAQFIKPSGKFFNAHEKQCAVCIFIIGFGCRYNIWWVFRYKWIALVGYPAFCVLWLYSCSNWLAYFDQVLAAFIFKLAGWYYALSIYTSCRFYIKVVGCIVFGHSWMSFGIVFGQLVAGICATLHLQFLLHLVRF